MSGTAATLACTLLILTGCARAPESFAVPAQYTMPPGVDPPTAPPDPNRMLVILSEPDAQKFIASGVLDAREGAEWRFTEATAKLHFPHVEPGNLDFYLRCYVHPDHVKVRGKVRVTVTLNGKPLGVLDYPADGIIERRIPIPPGMLSVAGPVEVQLGVDPLFDKGKLGVLLHSVGFVRRSA